MCNIEVAAAVAQKVGTLRAANDGPQLNRQARSNREIGKLSAALCCLAGSRRATDEVDKVMLHGSPSGQITHQGY